MKEERTDLEDVFYKGKAAEQSITYRASGGCQHKHFYHSLSST